MCIYELEKMYKIHTKILLLPRSKPIENGTFLYLIEIYIVELYLVIVLKNNLTLI